MDKPDLMLIAKNLMVSSGQSYSTDSQTTPKQQVFSDHERDVTGYLFAKLLVLYAGSFYLTYPSVKEVDFAKREYAKEIGRYSRDQIDIGLRQLAKLAISREKDDRIYREPNLPAFLALLDEVARWDQSHKLFLPVPPESEEDKQKRIAEGLKNTQALLAMFPEPTPAPTVHDERLERLQRGE